MLRADIPPSLSRRSVVQAAPIDLQSQPATHLNGRVFCDSATALVGLPAMAGDRAKPEKARAAALPLLKQALALARRISIDGIALQTNILAPAWNASKPTPSWSTKPVR